MILRCENCHTRYLLSASLLGADGRRVRCSQCGHEWYQDPPEDESFARALEEATPIPDSVKPTGESGPLPVANIVPDGETPAHGRARTGGYLAAAGVLLLALVAGFAFSGSIVKLWPQSLAVYDLVGAAPHIPGQGLTIDRVRAEIVTGDRNLNMLEVRGYAANLTKEPLPVPPLRVSLLDADGLPIDSWLIEPAVTQLGGEEETAFTATYPAPPVTARQVNVHPEPFTVIHRATVGNDPAPQP